MLGSAESTLLIYAPVPLFRHEGTLWLEGQACNGLRLWAENFEYLNVMMPVEDGTPPPEYVPLPQVGPSLDRIAVHTLPTAYRPDQFARAYRNNRAKIRELIDCSDYLSFAIGGLFGDWGSVACIQAHNMNRHYAVWTDRVESQVIRRTAHNAEWKARLKSRLYSRPMAMLERHVIRRSTLGLFHGKDTFDTYAPYCRNPKLVHDIHIAKSDHIGSGPLETKIASAGKGPLKLTYVGRADAMKGPMDWIEVLSGLAAQGIDFQATWIGDGDLLERMKARVSELGLNDRIALPGFSNDRDIVLSALRRSHLFLFCHKTPESPRCLIEALVSGTPIVGYASAFSEDLINAHGGGRLVALNDQIALSAALADLAVDRNALADLIKNAAMDGAPFDDVSVFQHRSEIIKENL